MLSEPFVTKNGIIELPGPFFEQLIIEENMTFTEDLLNGLNSILPNIKQYKVTAANNILRISVETVPDNLNTLLTKGWEFNAIKKQFIFNMI